jgi:hypothetical protein
MALDLGELVGSLKYDATQATTTLHGFERDLVQFGDKADAAGEQAGERFGDGFKDKGSAAAKAAGAAVGAAVVYGINGAMDRQSSSAVLAARLGLDPKEQERLGRVAGRVYAGAYGDSMDEVNTAIWGVRSSLRDLNSGRDIGRATKDALNFAAAFDVDVTRSVQVAGQLIRNGLVKDSREAFDLMIKGSQKVPAAIVEDLIDTADEYGQFFKLVGLDGPEAFKLLIQSTDKGAYGLDKTADAIKEFGVLATDGSKSTKDAFEQMGLDAGKMSNDVLAGGDKANAAFRTIVDGLLGIEDPSRRAQTAIALFGTPLEDLSVGEIPKFLDSLKLTKGGLRDVEGSAKDVDRALGDTAAAGITKMKRKLENDLVEFMAKKGLPALESLSDWVDEDGKPALEKVAEYGGQAAGAIGDMVGFINDMPDWAVKGSVGGVLGLIAAGKLANLASDLRSLGGGPGGVVSKATPVPVFVTNPGFGGPGGGDGGNDATKKGFLGALLANPLTWFTAQAGVGTHFANNVVRDAAGKDAAVSMAGPRMAGGGGGLGAPPGFFDFSDDEVMEEKSDEIDGLTAKVNGFRHVLDLVGATKVRPDLAVPGLREAHAGIVEFINLQVEAGQPISPHIALTGVERAMAQIATLNSGIDALRERGIDNGVPYLHGGTARPSGGRDFDETPRAAPAGVTVNIGEVKAHDYKDFMKQMDRQRRMHGHGGFRHP